MDEIDKCTGFWYNVCKKRRICRCTLPNPQGSCQTTPVFVHSVIVVAPYLIRKEAAARGVTPEKIDATIAAYFDVMAMVEIEIEAITGKVNRP